MESCASIRDFWFGNNPDDTVVSKEKSALWWAKDTATDTQMRERFGGLLHRNAILGRESSVEELAFLQGPGASF